MAVLVVLARPVGADPVSVTPLPPVEEADGRAGACYSFYEPDAGRPFIPMAYDAGSRWDRFDFIWPNLEPANDTWNPDVLDAYDVLVDDLGAEGMNMVGILLWTPDWAATGGRADLSRSRLDQRVPGWYAPDPRSVRAPLAISAASSPPQGLDLPWDDPNNHWGDYVYTIVSRYSDRVKHWEMWNEPEWSYFWTGTSAEYAQLLKVGYQATKAACPDCTVLFGGLHYWANPDFYKWVLNTLDVMSVHLYRRSADIYSRIDDVRDGMRTYDVADHPIWLTETGVPVWDDDSVDPDPTKYNFAATQEEAAAYVIQSYANAWASGVERYFFFRVHDADMGEYFGLIRNDRSLRSSYVAYQVAATYLVSPTFVTRVITDSQVNVTLWGTPHGKVSVLWNEDPATGVYTLPAALPTATFVDRWGGTRAVTATSVMSGTAVYDVYTATLPSATANLVSNASDYIIGGDPVIMVESESPSEPPTSTVQPLPELTYSPIFTVTWEGRDNQAGIWFYDVQVRDEDGEWADWLRSTPLTAGQFVGRHDHTYYFRSRATDLVGNQESWPEEPQAQTRLMLSGTLYFDVGALFADENRNDSWDRPILTGTASVTLTEEITLTDVSLRFRGEDGRDVVSPTVGGAWAFTTTVLFDQIYQLWTVSSDGMYLRALPVTMWPINDGVVTYTREAVGLWPVRWTYLPLILKSP
jgi:hypothetical protein